MVITRLSKWFGIELHCVSTDRVSDLAAIEWFRSQRLNTGACKRVIRFILILMDHNIT